jgi:(2Fe-2S) ferredoxin
MREPAELACEIPVRYVRHVFVCIQHRDGGGKPACGDRGGTEILARVEALLAGRPETRTGATGTACLGPCFDGPNAVVYPDGVWYGELEVADASAIVEHLASGTLLTAKVHPWTDDDDDDDVQ